MNLENPNYWRLLINQSFLRFFLLKTLSKKEIHGYGLQTALTVISNGLCRPSQGTIYPALKELEKKSYVTGRWKKARNRKRKVYLLTSKGRFALKVAEEVISKALSGLSFKENGHPSLPIKDEITEAKTQLPLEP